MTAKSKTILSSIVAVTLAIFAVVGFIVDAPQAIKNLDEYAPQWMANPDVWWAGFFIVFTGAVLWWIWRKPSEDGPLSSLYKMAASVSDRARRLVSLQSEIDSTLETMRETPENEIDTKHVFSILEVVFPLRIKALLGEQSKCEFESIVAGSKAKAPRNAYIACMAALPHLREIVWDELGKEFYEGVDDAGKVESNEKEVSRPN